MRRRKRPEGWGRIYHRPNTRFFWIEYWHNGKQYRESTKTTKHDDADKRLDERWLEICGKRFVGPAQERVAIPELLDDLVRHLEAKGAKAIPSQKSHLKPVRQFFSFARAVDLVTSQIRLFIEQQRQEGKANATINRELGGLRQALNLARREGRINHIPYFPMLKEDNVREGFFERDEVEAVIANLPDPLNHITRFGYLTGWRKSEITPLPWTAVDRKAREIRLRTSKNGRGRILPLEGELWELVQQRWAMREYCTPDGVTRLSDCVFHRRGRPVNDFRKSWASACKKAKVPGRLFHDLRRTAARDMIRAGVPESVAREITGHRTSSMFARYNITDDRDMRNALRRTQDYQASLPNRSNIVSFSPSKD